ncbi:MAG: polyamine ABC transporter substrate-binding protein [Chitinophagales bacterium]|nr:polyamine ABC transporter substrate-binding protein [Hyphomicrobiales bacterium]
MRHVAFGLGLLLTTAAFAQEKVVNFLNWNDYIDPAVLEEFTKETGIKVVYDVTDSNESIEAKIITGKSGYDLAVPTGMFLQRQIKAGVYRPLDKSKLTNYGNLWPVIMQRLEAFDPGAKYAIPYLYFTVGLAYNVDKVNAALGETADTLSWDLLFKPENAKKLAKCGIQVLDSPEELIPTTLNYLKLDPNSSDQKDLDAVAKAWGGISKSIKKFSGADYIDAIANGDLCVVAGYSGDLLQAKNRAIEAKNKVNINFYIPKEGAAILLDSVAIPKDAPHPEEAHALLNFLLRPDVAAKISTFVSYANPNLPSQKLLPAEIINNPAIYPDEATVARMFTILPADNKTRRTITRMWTRIKSGR